jgi:hypothetical protein
MFARIFELPQVLTILAMAVVAMVVSLIVKAVRDKESGFSVWPSFEAAILAVLGGLMARAFISILLGAANDSHGARLLVGWGFFVVPGLVDTFAWIHSNQPVLTSAEILMAIAGIAGAFIGAMGGAFRIYNWQGLGWLAFPVDVTWALAGNIIGCLVHIVNIGWGDHVDRTDDNEARRNAHHYKSGFGLRYNPRYAFTQGCVMSNLAEAQGDALYKHEMTHVWQNRGFGPMYTLTYAAWMVVWLIPAAIVGVVIAKEPKGLGWGINDWCYLNCPWETWAYAVQGVKRNTFAALKKDNGKMVWPAGFVIAWSVPFFALATVLAVLGAVSAWRAPAPTAKPAAKPALPAPAPAHKKHAHVIALPTPTRSAGMEWFTTPPQRTDGERQVFGERQS